MSDFPTVYKNDNVVMFDCDDTLVMWHEEGIQEGDIVIDAFQDGSKVRLRPHKKHIQLLKEFHARGQLIVVWSAGGYDWASRVVEMLKLENYVTFIMSKPKWFVDDLRAHEILGQRVYMRDSSKPRKYPENSYDDTDSLTARNGLVNLKDYSKDEEEQ